MIDALVLILAGVLMLGALVIALLVGWRDLRRAVAAIRGELAELRARQDLAEARRLHRRLPDRPEAPR